MKDHAKNEVEMVQSLKKEKYRCPKEAWEVEEMWPDRT